MAWFRVDDALSDHPKVLAAGNAAMGLWVRAGAWSMKHLTDGFIPETVAALLGTPREVRALVASGLWVSAEGGYRFHAWDGRQPTKEEVEERRRVRSEAGRKGGLKSRPSKREANREASASAGLQPRSKQTGTPSRPVPSRTQIDDGDTSRPGTKVDARDTDPVEEGFQSLGFVTAAARGRVLSAVRGVLPVGVVSDAEVVDVAREILAASSGHVKHPVAYVEKACVNSPQQVRGLWEQLPHPGEVTA